MAKGVSKLTPRELNVLRSICESLVPRIEVSPARLQELAGSIDVEPEALRQLLSLTAADAEADQHLARRIESVSRKDRNAFGRFLRWVDSPVVCFPLTGTWQRFTRLDLETRAQVVQSWCSHRRSELRKVFQSIKRLVMFLTYCKPFAWSDGGHATNPSWRAMGYAGRNPIPQDARSVEGTRDTAKLQTGPPPEKLECDVLIVGSGAGGSVAASVLAAAGLDCLIAEKGQWFDRHELGAGEYWGNRNLFEKHGSLSSDDLAIVILAGATVGGGTAVNWMTCLEPDEHVLGSWAEQFGWRAATNGQLASSFAFVRERLGVNISQTVENRQNAILRHGCESLGWKCQVIPRNAQQCGDCGYCGYGCRAPGKQDTRHSFLNDAISHGARLVPRLQIDEIQFSSGAIIGARARWLAGDGGSKPVTIRCRSVVCAGGAIQTPLLLMQSGISHPMLGQNLFLHPTTALASFHRDPVVPWSGQPQSVVCDEFSNLDGRGHGVRLEAAPVHPGFGALALAWQTPLQHKLMMARLSHMANSIVICRDQTPGRVRIDSRGRPNIQYQLGAREADMLLQGVSKVAQIHEAAGAEAIVGPHQELTVWERNCTGILGEVPNRSKTVQELNAAIIGLGARANHLSLFSAHQMSTCRLAADDHAGPVDLVGQFRGIRNLFVCDGSLLPTSTGVNPMISIMGAAHWVAQRICEQIERPSQKFSKS